jgi:eukaryotic-like serine/threonine-protein kinase
MSPEQASARRGVVDHRTDVYSLGVTLYEMLTLRPAFEGRDREEVLSQMSLAEPRLPARLNAAVPRDLETIVLTAMAKFPQERYATAKSLANDLSRFLAGQAIHAKRPGVLARVGKWAMRHRAWVAAIGMFLLVLVGGAGISAALVARARHGEELQRAVADTRKLESRRHLYASHMNVAMTDWQKGNVARVLEALAHEKPRDGEEDLRGFEWYHLLRLCQGNGRAVLPGGDKPVCAVATAADGSVWASAGEDGSIRLWEEPSFTLRGVLHSSGGIVHGLAVSPDGQRLAAGCADRTIEIWDLHSMSLRHKLAGHKGEVTAVAFFPDGRRLASSGHEGAVRVWDTSDGQQVVELKGLDNGGNCVGVSPDGRTVAAAGNGRKVLLWNLADDIPQAYELGTHRTYVHCLAFSPDGTRLLSGSEDGVVQLWDMTDRRLKRKWRRHTAAVAGAAFAPQGHEVATVSWDGSVKVWDPDSPTAAISLQQGHAGQVLTVAFAPDGKSLLSGGRDGVVRVWNRTGQDEPLVLTGHRRLVRSVAFAADGKTLFSAAADGTARSWDLAGQRAAVVFDNLAAADGGLPADERELPKWAVEHQCVMGAVLLGGQTQLLTGDLTGELRLWDADSGSPLPSFESADGPLWALARSPDESVAAGAGYTANVVTLWNTTTGKKRGVLRGHTDRVWSVAFSPDSRLVASSSNDYTVRVWDVDSGLEVARIPAPTKYVFCVGISPDGRMVAFGGEDHRVRLYDLAAGVELEPLGQHPANLQCLAFFPDGKSLATGGADGTVKVWDLATRQERITLRVPLIQSTNLLAEDTTNPEAMESSVWSLAIASDGRAVAAGDGDGRITVWRAQLP